MDIFEPVTKKEAADRDSSCAFWYICRYFKRCGLSIPTAREWQELKGAPEVLTLIRTLRKRDWGMRENTDVHLEVLRQELNLVWARFCSLEDNRILFAGK